MHACITSFKLDEENLSIEIFLISSHIPFLIIELFNPFLPTVPQVEHSILAKIAKKFGQKWVNQKNEIFVGSHISKFLRPAQRYDNLINY